MNIQVGPESLIRLDSKFSTVYKKVPGTTDIMAYLIENNELVKLFMDEMQIFKPRIFNDPHIIGIFAIQGELGFISLFPAQEVQVKIMRCAVSNQYLKLPATIWVTCKVDNAVYIGGLPEQDFSKINLNTHLFTLDKDRQNPNWTSHWRICFGDDPLPERPIDIFEAFCVRPFSFPFPKTDLTYYDYDPNFPTITIEHLVDLVHT